MAVIHPVFGHWQRGGFDRLHARNQNRCSRWFGQRGGRHRGRRRDRHSGLRQWRSRKRRSRLGRRRQCRSRQRHSGQRPSRHGRVLTHRCRLHTSGICAVISAQNQIGSSGLRFRQHTQGIKQITTFDQIGFHGCCDQAPLIIDFIGLNNRGRKRCPQGPEQNEMANEYGGCFHGHGGCQNPYGYSWIGLFSQYLNRASAKCCSRRNACKNLLSPHSF